MPENYPRKSASCPFLPAPQSRAVLAFRNGLVRLTELQPVSGAGRIAAGQCDALVKLQSAAVAGRCTRCGGHTWQLQARDICGRCGSTTQHEVPEVRRLTPRTLSTQDESVRNSAPPAPTHPRRKGLRMPVVQQWAC